MLVGSTWSKRASKPARPRYTGGTLTDFVANSSNEFVLGMKSVPPRGSGWVRSIRSVLASLVD